MLEKTEDDAALLGVTVEYLAEFVDSLAEQGVAAMVVLGPKGAEEDARTVLTMHPWSCYAEATKLCNSSDYAGEWSREQSPLVAWRNLTDGEHCKSTWVGLWRKRGFQAMLRVEIPIAMGRSFECFLFSTKAFESSKCASGLAWAVMSAWPRIKAELVAQQQVLNHSEHLSLTHSARGLTALESAELMGTTERMVNFHIGNSLRKLAAPNKTAAVLKAILIGVI